jgi:hypothetical protein
VEPVHLADREGARGERVERRVDRAGAEADDDGGSRERREPGRRRLRREARGDAGGARREDAADAERGREPAREEAGQEVPGHVRALHDAVRGRAEREGLAERRPRHAEDGVGEPERDERDVGEREEDPVPLQRANPSASSRAFSRASGRAASTSGLSASPKENSLPPMVTSAAGGHRP